jgi:hypothetical protein
MKKQDTREDYPITKAGFIYAVRCGDKIKIGQTKNLESRMKQYKKGYHNFELLVTSETDDCLIDEQIMLEFLGGEALKNEWLDYSPELQLTTIDAFEHMLRKVKVYA